MVRWFRPATGLNRAFRECDPATTGGGEWPVAIAAARRMGGGRASTELPQNAARHDGGSGLNNNMHWPAEQSAGGISTESVLDIARHKSGGGSGLLFTRGDPPTGQD